MVYWLLTSEYPPFFGGGIGTYCVTTAKMMASRGHTVTVFINDASVSDIDIAVIDSIRIVRFNTSRTNSSGFLGHTTNISFEFAEIVKHFILSEGKPDCIEAQEYLGIAYYLLQYKKALYDWCRDVPVVITIHSPSFLYMEYNHVSMYRYPNYWICEMERFCLQAADYLFSPSNYILNELNKRFKLTNKKVSIVPNPFDTKLLSLKEAPESSGNEIIFFGKLTAQKGAFRLLKYFQKLWSEGFNRPLFLIGGQDIIYHPEGISMGDWIKRKYKNFIDEGLLILEGPVKPSDIATRIKRAEIVIIPSDNDNLPYVAFEMMSLGAIVLVSKQGGHSEVVEDGVDGFIFDHSDPETFFSQLKKILSLEENEKMTITKNAIRKITTNYNTDIIYKKKYEILKNNLQLSDEHIYPFIRTQSLNTSSDFYTKGERLSVVIPYFNMGLYIDKTIDSVLQSEYKNKEIIIVNDGSNEALSLEKLDKYRNREDIIIIDKLNEGLAKARNTGAEIASGSFLAFLDADDMVDEQYYSKAINVLCQYENVYFVGSWIQYFDESSKTWPAFNPEPPLVLYHNTLNTSALVYKKEAFMQAGINDEKMIFTGFEDYDSMLSMIAHQFSGIVLPEPLFKYRIRKDSMVRSLTKEKRLYLYQYIAGKHNDFYSLFSYDMYNLLNANGPAIRNDNPTLDYYLSDRLFFKGRLSTIFVGLIKKNKAVKTLAYKIYKLIKK